MFSPTPSVITDTGKFASSCAPAQYSGIGGPGTFEITTFSGGRMAPAIVLISELFPDEDSPAIP